MRSRTGLVMVLGVGCMILLAACVPEGEVPSRPSLPSVSASPPSGEPSPLPSAAPTSEASASPEAPEATGLPGCWTVAVPDVVVASAQTPKEFEAQNPGLVQSGAPATCSLFSDGSQVAAADEWIESFVAVGWTDGGVQRDDVYVSRAAESASGLVVSYLVSVDGGGPAPISQFMLYTR